jgi:branched-chain amino acid transport system permease protein
MSRGNLITLSAVVLLLVLFPVLVRNVEAISHYLDIMVFVGIFSLIAMGLSLLMGYAGQISLGHAAFWRRGRFSPGWWHTLSACPP